GLDPHKAVFFRQSDVPEVTELAWILGTVTNMGLLERAVSYKEKVEKGIEGSVGLFTYPVLRAADILLYRSHLLPGGTDPVPPLGRPLTPHTCAGCARSSLVATDGEKAPLAAHPRAGRIGYGAAKKLLKAKIEEYFAPARARRQELAARPDYVEDVLRDGARR